MGIKIEQFSNTMMAVNASSSSAVSSSAVRALALELKSLQEDPLEGIRSRLVNEDNLFEWEVALFGPPDTLYEGGYFKVSHLICIFSTSRRFCRTSKLKSLFLSIFWRSIDLRKCILNSINIAQSFFLAKEELSWIILPFKINSLSFDFHEKTREMTFVYILFPFCLALSF